MPLFKKNDRDFTHMSLPKVQGNEEQAANL